MDNNNNLLLKPHSLIVGASSGIGYSLAKRLSKSHQVTAVARRLEKLDHLKKFGVKTLELDVTDEINFRESIKRIVIDTGKLDNAIYCAGFQKIKPMRSVNDDDIAKIMKTNLIGPMILGSLFGTNRISKNDATFCVVSSIAAIRPEPGIVPYSVSKAGLNALIKGMAVELAPRRIVGVAPGWLDTELTSKLSHIYNDDFLENLRNSSPLGIADIDSIIDCIEFLLSNQAKFITGQIITVDGGSSL